MPDLTIYLRESDAQLLSSAGAEITNDELFPFVHYTQRPTVRIYFRQNDGTTAFTGLNAGDGLNVAVAQDYDQTGAPMCRTNSGFTIEVTLGYIEFELNTETTQFQTAMGTSADLGVDTRMEIQRVPSGDTEIRNVYQFPFVCKNIADDLSADPDPLPDNYPSWVEIQAAAVMQTLFNANTILKADVDDTPAPLTVDEQRLVGRITSGVITGLTPAEVLTLLDIATNYVAKALFDANTVLAATTDDTPAALTVAEQTILGRITGGNIAALNAVQVLTLLGVSADSAQVLKSLFNANTILAADTDNTPAALEIAEQTLVGRITGGNIVGLTAAQAKTLLGVIGQYRTCDIRAESMMASTTNGATSSEEDFSGNRMSFFLFDDTTQESVEFDWDAPEEVDVSFLKMKFKWGSVGGGSGEVVEWQAAAVCLLDDDALGTGVGTAQTVTDTWTADDDMNKSGATAHITAAGTPTSGNTLHFKISRTIGGSDTLTGDARLFSVTIMYKELDSGVTAW